MNELHLKKAQLTGVVSKRVEIILQEDFPAISWTSFRLWRRFVAVLVIGDLVTGDLGFRTVRSIPLKMNGSTIHIDVNV